MFTTERTMKALKALVDACVADGSNEFTVTIKSTGDKLYFTVMDGVYNFHKENPYYYLVECRFPWFGGEDLESIAKDINRWDELIAEDEADKRKLAEYKRQHCHNGKWEGDSFDFYSDWHKDLYGYRPR